MANVESNNKRQNMSWFLLAVFSCIALVSLTSELEGKLSTQAKYLKWTVSAVSVSLTFSTLAVFANVLLKKKFVGTMIETGLAVLTCAMWAAVLPSIMNPSHNLAVSTTNGINHSNLYFTSWASLLLSLAVMEHCVGKYVKKKGENDEGNDDDEKPPEKDRKTPLWGGAVATTAIVAVSAGRLFQSFDCENADTGSSDDVCSRLKYGVSLGSLCCIIAFVWMVVSQCCRGKIGGLVQDIIDAIIIWIFLILWIVAVIYLTFPDADAPATQPGNVYFFTWTSFALFVALAMNTLMNCFSRFSNRHKQDDKAKEGGDKDEKEEEGDKDKKEEEGDKDKKEEEGDKDEAAAAEEGEATKGDESQA